MATEPHGAEAGRRRPEARGPDERPPEPRDSGGSGGIQPHTIIAASGASVAAALITSRFGGTGTVIGAALAPAVVMLVSSALEPRLERGMSRGFEAIKPSGATRERRQGERRRGWGWAVGHPRQVGDRIAHLGRSRITLALGAAILSALLGLLVIVVVESVAGKPLSGIGRSGPSGGTTLAPKEKKDELEPPGGTPEAEPKPEKDSGGEAAPEEKPPESGAQSEDQVKPQGGSQPEEGAEQQPQQKPPAEEQPPANE